MYKNKDSITPAHGGELKQLLVPQNQREALKATAAKLDSWTLTPRQICDLELIINGGFSPLKGFMNREDYHSVVNEMRLSNNLLWPIPVVLDVSEDFASKKDVGEQIALRDPEGVILAILTIEDKWNPDRKLEAEKVYKTTDPTHPGVKYLLEQTNPWYIGGSVVGLQLPSYIDFPHLRFTPAELRKEFQVEFQNQPIVAFQTRNPMHRAHQELTLRAMKDIGGKVLIHPVVGMTKPNDVDHYTRVRCYEAIMSHYPEQSAKLALLPLAMRMAGPREALWHAIIRKNYGCSHFIVGRDHAGASSGISGQPFYGPYDAQELLQKYKKELDITPVPFKQMVYVEEFNSYFPVDAIPKGATSFSISGTELRDKLSKGEDIPYWFTFPEVQDELKKIYPCKKNQGLTIFFTGLSGAGKSTIAKALHIKILELGKRHVTLLDGDIVRKHLSSELGFSKEHRELNITRIGYVASEITKHGGISICAPIAPYDQTRNEVRQMVESSGRFILVHVSTPLEECERRDVKGLYAQARSGKLKNFTGISDPYESPLNPELRIDTTKISVGEAVKMIIDYLQQEGHLI